MLKFNNRIVQFGFGAVGKSFYEKIRNEISYDENNYFIMTCNVDEYEAFINLGGIAENFLVCEITKENYIDIFSKYLSEGDLLIDFADSVGTRDILKWCCDNNIMYINTGEADWPDNWYSIFEENVKKHKIIDEYDKKIKVPIVLQHGNNPGLVSHFVKCAIEYIITNQFKHNKLLKKMLKEKKFNEIAKIINIKQIHVNDIDLQKLNYDLDLNNLFSTWCPESFFFEMLSEATQNIGYHEDILGKNYNLIDKDKGYLEHKSLAIDTKCKTFYSNGYFEGYLVPHEETITIADSLSIEDYRPSVMFIYSPCEYAMKYFKDNKLNNYPNVDYDKPLDCEGENAIVRGYKYPNCNNIAYKENITNGTEYVGVLLIGDNFDPVWVGNRIEIPFLYKKKNSYWQTPTITPVAMSALAATCWMIKNKKSGIFFPDDIDDYKYIIHFVEKYISRTIYKTFDKDILFNKLSLNKDNIQSSDIYIKK